MGGAIDTRVKAARARAVLAMGAFALGLVLARWAGGAVPAWGLLAGSCAPGALALVLRARVVPPALWLGMVLLGAGWGTLRWFEPAHDRLDVLVARAPGPGIVKVEGVALDRPRPVMRAEGVLASFGAGGDAHGSTSPSTACSTPTACGVPPPARSG